MENDSAKQRRIKRFIYAESVFLLTPFLLIFFLFVAADNLNADIYVLGGLLVVFFLIVVIGFFIGFIGAGIYFTRASLRPALLLLLSAANILSNGFSLFVLYQLFANPWQWRMF